MNGKTKLDTTYRFDPRWIADRNKDASIYFSLNTPDEPLRAKPRESDIAWCRGLHADLDCVSGDTASEKEEMFVDLECFNPPPTIIVDSGNGLQAIWLLEEPVGVTSLNRERLKSRNERLGKALAGDPIQSLEHLLRLPGTINHPNARKRGKGRVKVPARLLMFNDHRYKITDFDKPLLSLRSLNVPAATKEKIRTGVGAGDRSEACASVAMSMVNGGHNAEEIEAVLTNPAWDISDRVHDRSKFRTLEKALKWLREDIIPSAFEKRRGTATSTLTISDDVLLSLGMTAKEYAEKDIPPEKPAIQGFLSERKIALFHGGSGAGKSFLLAFLIAALASGGAFAHWRSTRPYLCLYLEAEMDETEFHGRVKAILSDVGNVIVIRPAQWEEAIGEPGPYLDNPEHQALLTRYMQLRGVEFFIAEPLSWLLTSVDEMSNDDTKLYSEWFRDLKNQGIGVITAHNEGWHRGRVRGASRLLDSVDVTFAVKSLGRGVFEITRGKTRTSMPMKPAKVVVEQVVDASGRMTLRRRHNKASRQRELLQTWLDDPCVTNMVLASTFDVDSKTITRDVKDMTRKGYLSMSGSERMVTEAGREWIERDLEA